MVDFAEGLAEGLAGCGAYTTTATRSFTFRANTTTVYTTHFSTSITMSGLL